MDMTMILDWAYVVGMILLGGLALWYRGHATLKGAVAAHIAQAEHMYRDSSKAGGVKFAWVVNRLYALLPVALRVIVSRSMVEQVVQGAFNAVSDYAAMQLDRMAERTGEQSNDTRH